MSILEPSNRVLIPGNTLDLSEIIQLRYSFVSQCGQNSNHLAQDFKPIFISQSSIGIAVETMRFPNRSDTNGAVQAQNIARS